MLAAAARATAPIGLLLLGALCGLGGCQDEPAGAREERATGQNELTQAPAKPPAPSGGASVSFAAATVRAGSLPGAAGRDPRSEADLVPVEMTAFEIDRAPFPGEPGRPATQMDWAGAKAACADLGKRLCSELEWERACNEAGPAAFASGAEWVLESSSERPGLARLRGGGQPVRCGARGWETMTGSHGFRCCRGAQQKARYPTPQETPDEERGETLGAKSLSLSVEDMRKALASVPSLAALAPAFTPFSTSDADAALRKGKRTRDGITVWSFLPSTLAWLPAPNDELVILAGKSGAQALIAVLYPLGDGTYAHAASAVLNEPDATIALATSTSAPSPRELMWTSCYGCPNEGGTIRYGDDRRVVIEFR